MFGKNGKIMSKKLLYLGIIEDHSGSMYGLSTQALQDTKKIFEDYQSSEDSELSVLLTVEECTSSNFSCAREFFLPIAFAKIPSFYKICGGTPLNDSIKKVVTSFDLLPNKNDPDVSFMIMVFTDGCENGSTTSIYELKNILEKTLNTNWTITFRGPNTLAFRNYVTDLGVDIENVYFWDGVSKQSYQNSTAATSSAIGIYTRDLKSGITSTKKFYTNLADVTVSDIQKSAVDISPSVKILTTTQEEVIKPFIERMNGSFVKGTVFYQLMKTEDVVQTYKIILIRDKTTGKVYGGRDARDILGLPHDSNCKVAPGNHGKYDVFIQSTSLNRKLPANTTVIIWDPSETQKVQSPSQGVNKPTTQTQDPQTILLYKQGYKAGRSHKARDPNLLSNLHYKEGYEDGRKKNKEKYL